MAVAKIEEYPVTGVAKVYLKPTKLFPQGWFYCDIEHLDLVERYNWGLVNRGKNGIYVMTDIGFRQKILFHQALAEKILGYRPEYIDHISGLEIDNTDRNMNIVTQQQNTRNKLSRGYIVNTVGFIPNIAISNKAYYDKSYRSEAEAVLASYYFRKQYFSDYNYNFYLDRRNDLDIVDLQYTGKISEEEATFKHVMRYAKSNAWYVYRYNLFDYFKQYNVSIPEFRLDERGYMIHPVTGQKLCPY